MKKYYSNKQVCIYQGNALEVLKQLPKESIQCVVTSPPYWGLRKYAGEQELIWDGDDNCKHEWDIETIPEKNLQWATDVEARKKRAGKKYGGSNNAICSLCGAWKGAYGLESQPEMYVDHTIEFLRAIRRVLKKDGVVFWNIGDSYWGGKGQSGQGSPEYQARRQDVSLNKPYHQIGGEKKTRPSDGKHLIIKPKDLCLIPFRVAIAAQEDGWWVRSVIIWSKPNPMPSSVKDRPTTAHEYILMLTKSAKYYWDIDAVREPFLPQSLDRISQQLDSQDGGLKEAAFIDDSVIPGGGDRKRHSKILKRLKKSMDDGLTGRNIRDVWQFATKPYPEAHFAVFPPELPRRCILAATSEKGNCSKCGKPWVRITKRHRPKDYDSNIREQEDFIGVQARRRPLSKIFKDSLGSSIETLGWESQCQCNEQLVPAIVLDLFAGSGTTGKVANELGRRAILIDISEEYCELARKRILNE